jgi:hypothetical protein
MFFLMMSFLLIRKDGFLFLCLFSAFSTKFINAFRDKRWLMIQVEQERCSIMDAVQLAPQDPVRIVFYHVSKIKIPTFNEAVDNLEDILHSGTENVHLLSFGTAVLQPKEERIFQQPSSSPPPPRSRFMVKLVFFFQRACSYYDSQILSQRSFSWQQMSKTRHQN